MKKFKTFIIACTLLFVMSAGQVFAQTMMPLPSYNGVYTGNTRGYWFTAPCDFTITGLRVPTNASTAAQYIAVLDFGTSSGPPSWNSTTNSFSVLANITGVSGSNIVNVNISIQQGHHIGFLASRGNVNAYSVAGNYTSNIDGKSVTLVRMGMQYVLSAPTTPQNIWQELNGSLSLVEMYYTVTQPILLTSATTIQPDTTSTPAGTKNKRIIGVKITTTGQDSFAKVTQFSFDTVGSFNYADITGPAKVYYTGNVDTFNTLTLFDSTSSKPTSAFNISGSQVLDTDTVYFWLTFDVDFNATVNNYLDAKCTEVQWDSSNTTFTVTPIISSPTGKIRITDPLKKINSITYTQPSTGYIYRYSTDNPVLRINLNVIGTAGTLNLNQLTVEANNTNNSDVTYVKLYSTTSSTFSNSNMIGTASTISGGNASFTSLNHDLPIGMSYIWVTYDIHGSATIFDTVDAKIPANGIIIGSKSYPSSEQNPSGNRIIFTNFQYDAGISSVLSPESPYCNLNQIIKARLYNYGVTTLTSDTINWTINGVAQSPIIWNGSLSTGNYTDLTLGNYSFSLGIAYTIKVFPSYINGIYADGYHQNDTATITFTIFPTPVANFSINDSFQCFKDNSFEFTNSTTIGSGIFTSNWSFGDASYSTTTSPSHSYQSISTFPVTLIVSSAYGCLDSISRNISLKPNQTTDFSMSDTARCFNGNSFSFTNNTTFNSGTYTNLWSFGDNSSSTATSPSHTYTSAGTYQVKLITTTNTGCIDSLMKTVYVNFHPVTSFQITTDTVQCLGTNLFEFNNTSTISSGTFSNLWSLGDNTNSSNTSPTKVYANKGSYTIKLVTTSNFGCTDSISRSVTVNPNPTTGFSITDSSQCNSGNNFIFTNSSSISSGTYTNLWNFGDLTTSTIASPTKTYNTGGIYDVKLVTTSNLGCKDSATRKAYVRPNTSTYFVINDTDQCLKANSYSYANTSSIATGTFTNSWKFGDNTSSSLKSPTKKYVTEGIYTVKLTTTSNYGCKDSVSRKIYVRPHPATSFTINDSSQCVNDNSYVFTNNSSISSGTFTNQWEFGDNNKSTVNSPVYSYISQGTFTVKLTTTSNHGCKSSTTKKVIISPRPFAYFTQGMTPQCLRSNLFFMNNNSSVGSGTIANTFWKFGDGDSSDLYSPKHKYATSGIFTISLKVVTNFGCSDTSSRIAEVIPQPEAGMIISDTALCFKNNLFQFTDDSKATSGSITGYYWSFGDGKSSNSINTSHSFKSTKLFNIIHIVTSSNNCTDTVTQIIVVHPMPVALFTIDDSIQCQQDNSFAFTNNSTPTGGGLGYHWLFGDNGTSSDENPSHSYSKDGSYTIKLIALTPNNCPDTTEKTIIVKETPMVDLGKDTTLYHNQSITLDAGGVYDSYLWSNSKTSSTIEVDTTEIGLDNTTLFWVEAVLQGCEGSDSINITFIHNVSINDLAGDIHIIVYPNPTKDFIYIGLDKMVKGMKLSLTDMNGKILKLESVNDKSLHRIDMREFADGIYFLNFISTETIQVMKVIKY